MARPGIVHLRDLSHRYAWDPRKVRELLVAANVAATDVNDTWRSFDPPMVIVLVVNFAEHELLAPHIGWLRRASYIVLVLDDRERWLSDDLELRAMVDDEWNQLAVDLPVEIFTWRTDEHARAAVARAIEIAKPLGERRTRPPAPLDIELPASGWHAWTGPTHGASNAFAAALDIGKDTALLVDTRGACDLASPRSLALDHPGIPLQRQRWVCRDPHHPVRWSGQRMGTYWWHGSSILCRSEHDWPCGPAKKRWGGEDNHPRQITMAPDASATLHAYGFDVLYTEEVPLVWTRAGDVDVAMFALDPQRALFYQQSRELMETSLELWASRGDSDDERELPPAMVLGPSPACRYAIDLAHQTLRVRGHRDSARTEHIGGPDPGFAVYDRNHELVRRATGRLLGGSFRYATVDDGRTIWREDLETGTRYFVAKSDTRPDEVERIAVPGTRNILEIAKGTYRVL